MNKLLIILILLIVIKTAAAQLPVLQWAKAFVPHNEYNFSVYSNGRSVAVDHKGNVYSAGLFNYTTDFDPGPGLFTLTASTTFSYGIYISKLSATGDFIWVIQIPALVEFGNIEIELDKDGNVYLASELRQPTDFDPGSGVYILKPIGGWDAFVAKYDTNGNFVWAKQFGGPGDTVPRSNVLDIDNNNNVVICGNFNHTVDFDPGPNTYNITSSAHLQSFIVKLTSNGDFMWARQFGNSSVVYSGADIADIKCDAQGNIYTVGNFSGICDFDPGSSYYPLKSSGMQDGFIAKLNADGEFIWAKQIGNTTNDYHQFADSRGIDIDADNNVYTTGDFIGTFDFDPGLNTHIVSSNSNSYDWYVLKLNQQGDFVWADVIGGTDTDMGTDIAVGNDGSIYTIGSVSHITDMDPGPGVHTVTTESLYGASVLTKLTSNGDFLYVVPFEGTGTILTRRMAVDNLQNIYITGAISGTIDFDPSPNVYPLSSSGEQAPFVLKLAKCTNITTSFLTINTCNSFTLNKETFDSSGTYIRTSVNSKGCDSIVTLHLIINKKYTELTKTICNGETVFAGGAIQSITGTYKDTLNSFSNCDSVITTHLKVNPKPVPVLGPDKDLCAGTKFVIYPGPFAKYLWQNMATFKEFTVNATGLYWVTVTNEFNCSATDSIIIRAILPSPVNFLKKSDSICSYESLPITATTMFNKYLWSTGEIENQIKIDKPGIYWLKVTDLNQCIGTDSISVYPKKCMSGVYIPNAFTPNNDGKNDSFKALVFGKVKAFRLRIFDRAGQIIFETSDPLKGWDGLNKGASYSATAFVWQCSYQLENRQPEHQKGTVLIVR